MGLLSHQPVYYSDSEEEDAPHFNRVYNYTKLENIRGKDGRSLVDNRVSDKENNKITSLSKELADLDVLDLDVLEYVGVVEKMEQVLWGRMLADDAKIINNSLGELLRLSARRRIHYCTMNVYLRLNYTKGSDAQVEVI
jgi:hypothetical protein